MWSILWGHWKTYQMKVYNKHYKQELHKCNEQEKDKESSGEKRLVGAYR